jgi:hypothetical protein
MDQEGQDASPLRLIARHLLDNRLDELTTTAVARVQADEPEYAGSMVSRDDLTRAMRRTLALALIRLLGETPPDDLATAASEVGRLRAEQGLPLPALLHSYRIDLRILWDAIIAEGRARGYATDEAFLASCVQVWEAVEANIADVVDAYRRTEENLARRLDVLRGRAFERLVLSAESDPNAVREASTRLDLPSEARYLVVVGEEVPVSHETLVAITSRLRARGLSSHFAWIENELIGIVLLAGRRPADIVALLEPLSGWRCGGAVVDSLAGIPKGTRLARAVIPALPGPGVQLLSAHWSATVVTANRELAAALAEEVLGPLLALPHHERAAVFETLDAYIDGAGSVTEVASLTLRHRNTIRNRLQTVERITGLSLSKPKDLTTLTLAMEWCRGPGGIKLYQ